MGMTVVEKILARASGRDAVRAGDVVEPRVDLAMSHENAALVLNQFAEVFKGTGLEPKIWDPSRIAIIFDHRVPGRVAEDREQPEEGPRVRGEARHHPVPRHARRRGRDLPPDPPRERLRPPRLGGRRHRLPHDEPRRARMPSPSASARPRWRRVWALGVALNVEVPPTIKVVVNGAFARDVGPKDLILHLVGPPDRRGRELPRDRVPRQDDRDDVDVRAASSSAT